MRQELAPACNHRKKGGVKCEAQPARPMFTAGMKEWSSKHPQPRWLCAKHWPHHHRVNAWGEEPPPEEYKSYEVVDGKLVPAEIQYGEAKILAFERRNRGKEAS